jgi:hypothetical protein
MKKIILLLAIFCTVSASSQEIKPILIGGVGQMYHDDNDRGHYYYGYLDWKPIQNHLGNVAFGFYAKYNYWHGIYGGEKMEEVNSFGGGLSFGFIPNSFFDFDAYNNISIGYKESKHISWTKTEELPDLRKKFIDMAFYSHLMDEYSIFFFRHKLFIDMSYNIDSSFVNENFRIKLDESIYNFYVGEKMNLAPKIILGYTNSPWHNFYEIGLGADLFGQWFVNIVDISAIYRHDSGENQKSYLEISIGVDVLNLFNN